LIIDYSRNTVSNPDPAVAKMEVLRRIDENVGLKESLDRDKVNQVAVDVVKVKDKYQLIEGFCRSTYLTDMHKDGVAGVTIKCEVHDIDPDDDVAFWLIQTTSESRTNKTPLARAMTAKKCHDIIKQQNNSLRQCDIANRLNISTGMLSNYLSVANNNSAVDLIRNGYMEFTTAQLLIKNQKETQIPLAKLYEIVASSVGKKYITQSDINNFMDIFWIDNPDQNVDDIDVSFTPLNPTADLDEIHADVDILLSQNPLERKKDVFVKQFGVQDVHTLQTLDNFVKYASNV
jgi:predicted transcriptional regulator